MQRLCFVTFEFFYDDGLATPFFATLLTECDAGSFNQYVFNESRKTEFEEKAWNMTYWPDKVVRYIKKYLFNCYFNWNLHFRT
jgi:hypothetical protein